MKKLVVFAVVMMIVIHQLEQPANANAFCLLNECGPPGGLFTIFSGLVCKLGGLSGRCSPNFGGPKRAQFVCIGIGNQELLLRMLCGTFCHIACLICGSLGSHCSVPRRVFHNPRNSVLCDCN